MLQEDRAWIQGTLGILIWYPTTLLVRISDLLKFAFQKCYPLQTFPLDMFNICFCFKSACLFSFLRTSFTFVWILLSWKWRQTTLGQTTLMLNLWTSISPMGDPEWCLDTGNRNLAWTWVRWYDEQAHVILGCMEKCANECNSFPIFWVSQIIVWIRGLFCIGHHGSKGCEEFGVTAGTCNKDD